MRGFIIQHIMCSGSSQDQDQHQHLFHPNEGKKHVAPPTTMTITTNNTRAERLQNAKRLLPRDARPPQPARKCTRSKGTGEPSSSERRPCVPPTPPRRRLPRPKHSRSLGPTPTPDRSGNGCGERGAWGTKVSVTCAWVLRYLAPGDGCSATSTWGRVSRQRLLNSGSLLYSRLSFEPRVAWVNGRRVYPSPLNGDPSQLVRERLVCRTDNVTEKASCCHKGSRARFAFKPPHVNFGIRASSSSMMHHFQGWATKNDGPPEIGINTERASRVWRSAHRMVGEGKEGG